MSENTSSKGQNPLLLPFSFPPFNEILVEHYEPAIDRAMNIARDRINSIRSNSEKADFTNTIEALETASQELDRVTSILFNLHSAETSDELEKVTEAVSPKLASFGNDILLDQKLFERVEFVWKNEDRNKLDQQAFRLLEKTYKSFKRNGASLSDEKKDELRKIDEELSLLSLQFGQIVLKDTNKFFLHLSDEKLTGLPEHSLDAARQEAKNRDLESGGVITLQYPSYVPAMTYLKDRKVREKLYVAFGTRGLIGEENNRQRVFRIAELRKRRATILGYSSHAAFVLEERMAKTPETVIDFLNTLYENALKPAEKELEDLRTFAKKDGIEDLKKWDVSYYTEKLKQSRFQIDSEKLKAYFPLPSILNGAFEVAKRLYGLKFKKLENVPVYYRDVDVYQVEDADGRILSHLYTDFFPRSGKRAGAWKTSYRSQQISNGVEERPLISIVCNFNPPSEKRPSLLSFQEVTTLFHEFGHALHGMLAEGRYASINGTSVYWDFVELPSQLMENWCYEEECLSLFAQHFETNESLPIEEIQRLRKASNFMEGMHTLRQLGFGMLDMRWHHEFDGENSLEELESAVLSKVDLLGPMNGTAISTAFSHIFQGGYSAGYYSYKWSEVLDADAFEYFKEKGIFDQSVAKAFRQLLSSGGQIAPDELYRHFRGRDADPNALLRRAGLLSK